MTTFQLGLNSFGEVATDGGRERPRKRAREHGRSAGFHLNRCAYEHRRRVVPTDLASMKPELT